MITLAIRAAILAVTLAVGAVNAPVFKAETEEGRYERYSIADSIRIHQLTRDLWTTSESDTNDDTQSTTQLNTNQRWEGR
jgi:hypothetical protein